MQSLVKNIHVQKVLPEFVNICCKEFVCLLYYICWIRAELSSRPGCTKDKESHPLDKTLSGGWHYLLFIEPTLLESDIQTCIVLRAPGIKGTKGKTRRLVGLRKILYTTALNKFITS